MAGFAKLTPAFTAKVRAPSWDEPLTAILRQTHNDPAFQIHQDTH